MDRNMIDASSGGALGNITPVVARQLIENMTSNSKQFGTRSHAIVVRGVHDVGVAEYTKKLESKIDALTTVVVNQLASNQRALAARVCGLCTSVHFTDSCPTLQQQASSSTPVDIPQAYATNIFNNNKPQHQQQNHHDLSTNKYNLEWRNHPNLRWGNQVNQQQQNQPFQNVQPPPQQRVAPAQAALVPPAPTPALAAAPTPSSSSSLEELVRMMTLQNMQF